MIKQAVLLSIILATFHLTALAQCLGTSYITYNPSMGCDPFGQVCLTLQGSGWVMDPMIITLPDGSVYNVNQELAFGLPIDQQLLNTATGGVLPCFNLTDLYTGNPNGEWIISVTNTGTGSLTINMLNFNFIVDANSCPLLSIDEITNVPAQTVNVAPSQTESISICTGGTLSLAVIDSIDRDTVCAGADLWIYGKNFASTTNVTVGGTPVAFVSVQNDSTLYVNVGEGTTGTIAITNALGTATSVDVLTVITIPVVINVLADTICLGDAITLSATAGPYTYQWSTGETSPTYTDTPTTNTTYYLDVEDQNNCVVNLQQDIAVINCTFNIFLGNNQNVCSGYTATLYPAVNFGTPPFTYQWAATGNNLSCNTCLTPTAIITQNSTYIVRVTDAAGLTLLDTITYTVVPCNGCSPISNTVSGAMIPEPENWAPIVPGQPYVQSISFRGFDVVHFSQGFSDSFQYVIIDSIGNLPCGISWKTDQFDNRFDAGELGCILLTGVTNDPVGQYNLEVHVRAKSNLLGTVLSTDLMYFEMYLGVRVCNTINNNCPVLDSTLTGLTSSCNTGMLDELFVFLPLPSNQISCAGYRDTLTAQVTGGLPPYTYAWAATGGTVNCTTCPTVALTVNADANFRVTVTDAVGNMSSTGKQYAVHPQDANINVVGGSTAFCPGDSLLVETGETGSYAWSTGETSASIWAKETGTYSVSVSLDNGCTATGDTYLIVDPMPPLTSIIGHTSITPSQPYNYLIAQFPNLDYEWVVEGGAIQSGRYTNSVHVVWGNTPPYRIVLYRTNTTGCYDSVSISNIYPTGIGAANNLLKATAFPNPTTGTFTLISPAALPSVATIKVTNTAGSVILENPYNLNQLRQEVNLGSAAPGIYFVHFIGSQGSVLGSCKVIKH